MKNDKIFSPFRWSRNIVWDIQFNLREMKLQKNTRLKLKKCARYNSSGKLNINHFPLVLFSNAERSEEDLTLFCVPYV